MAGAQQQALYQQLLRIRLVEEALADRYSEWEMRCPMHLSIGQEAVAVGVSAALGVEDVVFGNHRAHAHYLARGGSLPRLFAELYGMAEGCCGGRGGSMHLIDPEVGFMGSTPIVGGTIPLAVGAALAMRRADQKRVAVVYFGDGCFEEGVVHESLNYAALHALPVIFVCENNGYSVYTRLQQRQPSRPLHQLAAAHGLHSACGDGNRVEEVRALAQMAVARARGGDGPTFLELATYRWREHCGPNYDDELGYRPDGELAQWQERCPLSHYERQLLEQGILTPTEVTTARQVIGEEIESAFHFARNGTPPSGAEQGENLYG
ncbi:MAG: thiamine pyrophosphate-dependent dehydrogenase E1 component subunit alpha [Gammaproteobacteria bacterium]|nr:thiamine pyrophosphate-dependent dehydrogenase E1 component subunit alpha [Gammaproteobacteria bacterium]